MKSLRLMQAEVREVNQANGWFDSDRTFGDDIALLHSEVSEMLEAFRDHGQDNPPMTVRDVPQSVVEEIPADLHETIDWIASNPEANVGSDDLMALARLGIIKPEGVGSEAADVLVRLLDTCERYGIDLQWEFDRKVAFNRTRGHRHGGKNL